MNAHEIAEVRLSDNWRDAMYPPSIDVLVRAYLDLERSNAELAGALRLFADGWSVEKRSLYDEEGVEGWVWLDAAGEERYTVSGDWGEPPDVPQELAISNVPK